MLINMNLLLFNLEMKKLKEVIQLWPRMATLRRRVAMRVEALASTVIIFYKASVPSSILGTATFNIRRNFTDCEVCNYHCYTLALCSPGRLNLGTALVRRGFFTKDTSVLKD